LVQRHPLPLAERLPHPPPPTAPVNRAPGSSPVQHANPGPALSRDVPSETRPIPAAASDRHYSPLPTGHLHIAPRRRSPPPRPRPVHLHDESRPTALD
jgi:hypothetical protein